MKKEEQKSEFERYIEGLFINAAELEKAGVLFIIIGYTKFIHAADLEIIEFTLEEDTLLNKDETLIAGQTFILLGYICLFIVAKKRLNTIILENQNQTDKIPIAPLESLLSTYEVSILANIIRLRAFKEIRFIDINLKNRTEELD